MSYLRTITTVITCTVALCLSLAWVPGAHAQQVFQHKGVDSRVDYSALAEIGQWDDRNYQLTQEDVKLLADSEAELGGAVPAFYRVEVLKAWPDIQKGIALYPRSMLNVFLLRHGGYLYDGKLYRKVERHGERYRLVKGEGGYPLEKYETYGLEELEKALVGEVRVTTPNGAAESAIKINHINVDQVIAGTNGPGSGQKMHYSTDGGTTWNQAAALPLGNTCCDPTVDWSLDGSLAYASALGECGSVCDILFYRSSDGGQTWNDLSSSRRRLTNDALNDKQFVHVDKFATSPHVDNIYITYHKQNVMQFARSTDFGDTWAIQAFSSATDQRGIGSDIATDKSGNVYYIWPATNSQRILLRKSTDGGASFGSVIEVAPTEASFDFPIPAMETRSAFIYVSVDVDLSSGPFANSIYAAWLDTTGPESGTAANNHARIQVAHSRDGGNTWSVSTPHETADSNNVDRFNPWMAVGPDGQVHVIFYDTRRVANRTGVDLFYSSSADGGVTWTAPTRVTDEISPNINDGFEWGDYNGMDIVLNDVVGIYTDNRNEGGGSADSVDVYAVGIPVGGGCTPQAVANAGADRTINEGDSTTLGTSALAGHTYSWSPGGSTAAQPSVSPTTTTTYTVTATTSCGSAQDSVAVNVIPSGSGGPQNAAFNGTYQAPACLTVGSSCDTNALVAGRNNLGPEPNQPNTLADSCADGSAGTYQSDESNERVVISTLDGGNFSEGDTVEIQATVWAWTTPSNDTLDLYYAADATNPSWTLITSITPSSAGEQTLSAQYTLPSGGLQAVRAQFRYQSTNDACSAGTYNDRDDVVFAVETAGGCTTNAECDNGLFCDGSETCNTGTGVCESGTAPSCGDGVSCTVDSCNEATDSCDNTPDNGACDNGLFCDGSETCDAINDCQAGTAPNCDDGISCTVDSCNEGADSCNNAPDDSACDNGQFCDGSETCNAAIGCEAGITPCSGSQTCNETTDICEGGGGPQNAVYNAGLGAPACAAVGSGCDSGTLLDSRNGLSPAEPNQPNTLDSCTDGTSGTYHSDESNDRIVVSTVGGGDFTAGATVQVEATVWAWNTGADDTLDLYYAADANNPSWVLIGSQGPSAGGQQTLSAQYTLPTGSLQAVRANFRYQGSASSCSGGAYDDADDLVFAVNSGPGGGGCAVDEDFEAGSAGWNTSGSCTTGTFVLGTPTQQTSTVVTQVGGDHTSGSGNALFTATNSTAGNADVDGGECAVTSPVYNVTDASTLSIWYFHGQRDAGDDAAGDYFVLEASINGGAYVPFVSIGDVQTVASWTNATTAAPAGSTVQLRVRVSDGTSGGDIVEGGIDDLSICAN